MRTLSEAGGVSAANSSVHM